MRKRDLWAALGRAEAELEAERRSSRLAREWLKREEAKNVALVRQLAIEETKNCALDRLLGEVQLDLELERMARDEGMPD
jgi:hypothetical protein